MHEGVEPVITKSREESRLQPLMALVLTNQFCSANQPVSFYCIKTGQNNRMHYRRMQMHR